MNRQGVVKISQTAGAGVGCGVDVAFGCRVGPTATGRVAVAAGRIAVKVVAGPVVGVVAGCGAQAANTNRN